MKKFTFYAISCFLLMTSFALSSCESSESGSSKKVSGWYAYTWELLSVKYGTAYNFENSNTVVKYSILNNTKGYIKSATFESVPGHSGWYYRTDMGGAKTYTYSLEDNKIYIPLAGEIITIKTDGTLVLDGSSDVYKKW